MLLVYHWAACAPSHKMGFRSSVSKSGHPGEGRHEGLVPRNDVFTNGFIWVSLAQSLARILFVPCLRSPWKTRCEPEESYLPCSKRFDHGSHSIIFLLFEFKSVRWCWRSLLAEVSHDEAKIYFLSRRERPLLAGKCWRWETQRNARVAFKPTRRSQ